MSPAPGPRGDAVSERAAVRLRVAGLRRRFGRREVVRGVSLTVAAGEIVGLLGPNGAGKTTSFNLVAGLLAADAGEVHLGGEDLCRLPLWRRVRRGLGYLPQEPTVLRGLSATDNLLVALEAQGLAFGEARARAADALVRAGLAHVGDVLGQALSGGERRRLEMARALLCGPQVLLLDEPFAGVDPIAVGELQTSVRAVAASGVGVLVTDHNAQETLRLCDRAYLIAGGTIVAEGPPEALVNNPTARKLYLGEHFCL